MAPVLLIIIFLNAAGAPLQGYQPAQYGYSKLTDCQAQATSLNAVKSGTFNVYRAVCIDTTAH